MNNAITMVLSLAMCPFSLVAAATPAGLLVEWRFDEGQGKVAHDTSEHGHDAQIHGATWLELGNRFVLNLDGVDGHVDGGSSRLLNVSGPITIEAWIRPMDKAYRETILFGEGYRSYALSWYNTDICVFYIGTPARYAWGQVTLGQWNHVVATYDGKNVSAWINGRLTSTVQTPITKYQPTGRFMIAAKGPDGRRFKGMLGAVRVYDRALAPDEIRRQYLATIPTDTSPFLVPH